ncbi:nuclear transport factor 2 family protein [[Mycobacterium] crassicus]|uniref:Nuclear transport factor 2 family protein n=1 Tax=[Mycobacterium] crassicus TaxID=2872309 RepID=A0ABU5XF46_9MYCO|nr:nuclear transport factor 2 family protein [Mycolicibacter sp. MYC098]MEB3020724.1 nuclear transport factor 2 family protein [Mycolicibacter sp. MYC098]
MTAIAATSNTPLMDVRATIDTYLRAWMQQDPDLIVTIFTEDAIYHERVLGEPIRTRAGIRDYWQTKVVEGQGDIDARLLNLYTATDGITVIAEWEATFDDRVQGRRKRIREVAILEFAGERIASLREYWASEVVG